MSGILWLASYPKSGNTWVRVLLTNYLRDAEVPADIDDLDGGPIASSRSEFDDRVGVAAADLTPAEVARYRPLVYEQIAAETPGMSVMKIHDAFLRPDSGPPTVTAAATHGVIYVVRNPLDVAVSLAFHLAVPVSRAVAFLDDPDYFFSRPGRGLPSQLPQPLLTWSGHVTSWVDDSGLPVHVVRYEDLLGLPGPTLGGMLAFAGLEPDPARVEKALAFSRFEVLKAQEADHGFRERLPRAETFFRKGGTGDWRNHLTPDEAQRIVENHRPVMERFGYLSETGESLF